MTSFASVSAKRAFVDPIFRAKVRSRQGISYSPVRLVLAVQPTPIAETSGLLFPNLSFSIVPPCSRLCPTVFVPQIQGMPERCF